MTWTHALTGSYLTHDQTGAPKPAPTLWLPEQRRLFIPDGEQEHARPVIVLRGEGDVPPFGLMLYRDRIEGQFKDQRKTLVTL